MDRNIFKNALAVGIPGTGEKGLRMAVALALVAGKSKYKLEVLKDARDEDVLKAKQIVNGNNIHVAIADNITGLYVEVKAVYKDDTSRVVIKDKHDNIVLVEKNGGEIYKNENLSGDKLSTAGDIKKLTVRDIWEFVEKIDINDLDLVVKGIEMNKKMAEAGIASEYGKVFSEGKRLEMDYKDYAKYLTSIASYASHDRAPCR